MSDSDDEVADRQFKMVLLGDPQVGKTSMVTRYAKEMFTKQGSSSNAIFRRQIISLISFRSDKMHKGDIQIVSWGAILHTGVG